MSVPFPGPYWICAACKALNDFKNDMCGKLVYYYRKFLSCLLMFHIVLNATLDVVSVNINGHKTIN